jgi:hypothetical protein
MQSERKFLNINEIISSYEADEITAQQVESIFRDPEEHNRLITRFNDLIAASEAFPEHKDALITPFLNDPDLYNKLGARSDIVSLLKHFPDHAKELLEFSHKHPDECSIAIDETNFCETLQELPENLVDVFINTTVSTAEQFATIFPTTYELANLPIHKCSDHHKKMFLGFILADIETYRHDYYNNTILRLFPEYENEVRNALSNTPLENIENTNIAESTQPASTPSTEGLFSGNNTNDNSEKKSSELFTATYLAIHNYLSWYNKEGKSYRGENTWLSWYNHMYTGKDRAEKLRTDLVKATNDDDIQKLINDFLDDKKTVFNNHSLATFLLDKLSKMENSPWADAETRYPGYTFKAAVDSEVTFGKK